MATALIAARNVARAETRDPWAVNEDAEYHEIAKTERQAPTTPRRRRRSAPPPRPRWSRPRRRWRRGNAAAPLAGARRRCWWIGGRLDWQSRHGGPGKQSPPPPVR
jgi:hypothetical protein